MNAKKGFRYNNRGISTVFIAIYIVLLIVILISSIFVGITVSNSGIASHLREQQDRNQERIVLSPKCLEVDQSSKVQSILINNTGAITVRIRSIYVQGVFICDPSTLPGDSYIPPKDSLRIQLSSHPIYLNSTTFLGNWTVTTERGTKFSDTGANLWLGSHEQENDPNKFYYGPLLLYFNEFHWSNDGGSTWNVGWKIPDTSGNVIWRIKIQNIDERTIILSTDSSFGLIQNSQQPNKIALWRMGPSGLNPPGLELVPHLNYTLYFSVDGPNSLGYMSTPIPISSNFLTIIGSFVEKDGTHKSFAQTIPFEAVLISGISEIPTRTTLNVITIPRTVRQSGPISGQVMTLSPGDPTVPGNGIVVIQYSSVGSDDWVNIIPSLNTANGGAYSGVLSPPQAGTYQFRSFFLGKTQSQNVFAASYSSPQTIVINKAASTITLSPLPQIAFGESVTLAATVNPSFATGIVNFEISTDSGVTYNPLGASTLSSGIAHYTYTPAAVGNNYRFRATYNGDSNVLSSPTSSAVSLTVNKANPTISTPTLNPQSPFLLGQSVTASVTVTGVPGTAPTGTVNFQYSINGGTTWTTLGLPTNLVAGSATSEPYSPATEGSLFRIRAIYNGDSNYNVLNGNLASLTVQTYPTVSSPTYLPSNSIPFGTQVNIQTTVSAPNGIPTGSMSFLVSTDGGLTYTPFSTQTLTGGIASSVYLPQSVGNYHFKANYLGDIVYLPIDGPSNSLTVNQANSVTTISSPSSAPAGEPLTITANITPTPATGTVTFQVSIDNGAFNTFSSSNIVSPGTATSTYTPATPGASYQFRAVYSGDSNIIGSTSDPVSLTAFGPLHHFDIQAIGLQTAGVPFSITLTAKDSLGNTVTNYVGSNTLSDSTGTIAPTNTGSFTAGTRTVTVMLTKAATGVTITANGGGSSGTSNSFTVNPGLLDHFSFASINTPQTAGVPFSISITAQDAYGNTVISYSGQNTLICPGINPVTTGSFITGTWTGSVSITQAGSGVTITTSGLSKSGTSNSFTVNAAEPTRFTFANIASPQTAGSSFSITIVARDQYGNIATTYNGLNMLTDTTGTINPASTPAFINGIAIMQASITKTGNGITIGTNGGGLSGTSNAFNVNSAALDHFEFNSITSPQTAGVLFSITITAKDAYGNIVTSYVSPNSLTASTGTISPISTGNFVNGAKTLNVNLAVATPSVTISTNGGGKSGTSNSFTVNHGPLHHFNIASGTQTAGTQFDAAVTAVDSQNNVITDYTGTIHFTTSDTQAILPPDYTYTAGLGNDNGLHTFTFTLKTAGTQSVTTTDSSAGVSTSNPITVNPASLDHFIITAPSTVTAGTSFGAVTVTAYDVYGNVKTNYLGQVYFTSSDLQAVLPFTLPSKYTFTSGDSGAHTFSGFTLKTAPTQTITVTDGTHPTTSATITVTPGALDHFNINPITSPQTAGTLFTITITAKDAFGNTLTTYTGTNTLSDTTGTVSPLTTGAFSSGVWSGNVAITRSGVGVTVSSSGGGKLGASNAFTVNPAALDHFTFNTITSPQTFNIGFPITITAKDLYGNTVTGYIASTSITATTGSGTISPASVTFANGQWIGTVTLNKAATGVILSAVNGGISGTSNPFNVYGSLLFSSIINPTTFQSGTNQLYTITITNLDSANNLGSATIAIPAGFSVSSASITSPAGRSWNTPTIGSGLISVTSISGSGNPIRAGESITITFTPTQTPSSGTTYSWTTNSFTSRSYTGPFNAPNPQPQTTIQYYLTVNSLYGGASGQGWYNAGTTAYAGLNTGTVSGGTGTQYVFTSWSGDTTGTNYAQSNSITMSGTRAVTANWQTQYYLTIASSHGSPTPTSGWYPAGSAITASVPNTADELAGTRYRCTGYGGTGSAPASGTTNSASFTLNAASTITWNWITQYLLTRATLPIGIGATPISVSPTSSDGFYDTGTSVSLTSTTPIVIDSNSQYRFDHWSGNAVGSSNPTSVTMDSAKSITANYATQYLATFTHSGLSSDATGIVATIGGSAKTLTDLPFTVWVDASSGSVSYNYAATVSSSTSGKQYVKTSIDSSPLTGLSGPITVTGVYQTQYHLAVNNGGNGLASGSGYFDAGTSPSFSISPTTVAGAAGVQYIFAAWSGDSTSMSVSDSILMDGPKTVTATWTTQFLVQYASLGAVLTVSVPIDQWVDANGVATRVFPGTVTDGAGTRCNYVSDNRPASVTGPTTVTAIYQTQYYLTVNNGGRGSPGGEGWYDADTNAQATITPLTVAGSAGTQYVFAGWTGDVSGSTSPSDNILMNTPKTATATWITQYKVTVVSAYGSPNPVAGDHWVNDGASFSVSVTSPDGDGSHRFVVIGPSTQSIAAVYAAQTLTFTWQEQFYLTVNASPAGIGSPTGQGWYDAGSTAHVSAAQDVVASGGRYDFRNWLGASGTYSDATVTMDAAKTATASYQLQFYLTVSAGGHGSTGGEGWYDAGTYTQASMNPLTVAGPTGTQYVFASWSGDASGSGSPSNDILMDGAKTASATWTTQYLVTFTVNLSGAGTTTPSSDTWCDEGTSALAISALPNVGFVFTSWTSSPTVVIAQPSSYITTAIISGPGTITANFALI